MTQFNFIIVLFAVGFIGFGIWAWSLDKELQQINKTTEAELKEILLNQLKLDELLYKRKRKGR